MSSNLSLIPDSSEMLQRFASETWSLSILILVVVLTVFTLGMYCEAMVFVHKRFEFGSRRGYIIFIFGLYPVHSVTSLLGLCIPTTAFTCNFLATMYLAMSLYVLVLLITEIFGGLDPTLRALFGKDFPLRQPPCCCMFCLPSVTLNKKVFHWIRIGVLQYIVVLLFFSLVPAILWVDQLLKPNQSSRLYSSIELPAAVMTALSTVVAVYSAGLLFRAASGPLSKFHLRGQFVSVQLVVLLVNIQNAILTFLANLGVIECILPLTCDSDLAIKTILNLLILFEIPLVLLLNRVTVGRWIRSGTHTEYFKPDSDSKSDVEGDKPPTSVSDQGEAVTFQRQGMVNAGMTLDEVTTAI